MLKYKKVTQNILVEDEFMGNKKYLKWVVPLALGITLIGIGGNNQSQKALGEESYTTPPIVLSASHTRVEIKNENLRTALRAILGKSSTEPFFEDDFLTNDNFKPVTDETTGKTTAPTYQINLSDSGVTDIRELAKFALPETLKGINLAGNNIKTSDLDKILTLINAKPSTPIIIESSVFGQEDTTITPACDFSNIIRKVNLNNNKIDLENISTTYLNENRLLFGIQNFGNIDSSGLVRNGEMKPMYYIRSDSADGTGDEHYISFSTVFEYSTEINSAVPKTYNIPTELLDFSRFTEQFGHISISAVSVQNTDTAYFAGYGFTKDFYLFDIKTKEDFWVERLSLLNLQIDNNGKLTSQSKLDIKGFGNSNNLTIAYSSPSTSRITKEGSDPNVVSVTLNYKGKVRTVPVEFVVKDTIAPVIKLKGSNYVYSSRGKRYIDMGYIAYDPATLGAESGESLDGFVRTTSTVKINTLGIYSVTYTVKDEAENEASVIRTVEIQERVLDTINLRVNNSELILGEDIILVVQPEGDVNISNYKDIRYYWYINGTQYIETRGDSITGKSTTTINLTEIGTNEIYVKLVATQNTDNAKIEVYSKTLSLLIEPQLRNNDTLILGACIAVVIILVVIAIITIAKYRKGKGNITGKHKNFHKSKVSKKQKPTVNAQPEIQVIKNYNGTTADNGNNGGEGGGNSNFRPPENQSNNNDKSL